MMVKWVVVVVAAMVVGGGGGGLEIVGRESVGLVGAGARWRAVDAGGMCCSVSNHTQTQLLNNIV